MMRFVLIFFLVGGCGLSEGMTREYIYHSHRRNWYDAQWHCKENSTDLATFSNKEEQDEIVSIFGHHYHNIWIGLVRENEQAAWKWSDGAPYTFSTWHSCCPQRGHYSYDERTEKNHYHEYNCAYLHKRGWINADCLYGLYFYCYRQLVLVNESKTWDDALQYCNTKYSGLASLSDITQVLQAKKEIVLTNTESVWTGLRFMDGRWFWLSGGTTENQDSLPSCSLRPYHCGAFNNKTDIWENRDCNEKLNFLCYWN